MLGRDGEKRVAHRCTEQTAIEFGRDVGVEECNNCAVRHFVLRKYKPVPRTINEARIDNPVKKPTTDQEASQEWPACKSRQLVLVSTCCDLIELKKCNNPDATPFGKGVEAATCQACKTRNN